MTFNPGEIADLHDGLVIPLPQDGAWPASVHCFGKRDSWAIKAAEAAGRPLLVRGLPGTGKSQLARALARHTGRLFIPLVVHSRTEPEDLKRQFDAVARLGEAQALGALGAGADRDRLQPERFLSPGPLWWAFHYPSALAQNRRCQHPAPPPNTETGDPKRGAVLLIDEIDKAEADLPNGLLEVLGNGGFAVPYSGETVRCDPACPPLVVITTNEERELPSAFVRRCLVLRLELPDDEDRFIQFLAERGQRHHPDPETDDSIRRRVARLLWQHREAADQAGQAAPGQAEYLDILRALSQLTRDIADPAERAAAQQARLDDIADFALDKAAKD